jgi:hypothetical protein
MLSGKIYSSLPSKSTYVAPVVVLSTYNTSHSNSDTSESRKQFPKKSEQAYDTDMSQQTVAIPIRNTEYQSSGVFDPCIINTPPSEFINILKNRLNIFSKSL